MSVTLLHLDQVGAKYRLPYFSYSVQHRFLERLTAINEAGRKTVEIVARALTVFASL
jgi:hypothetical protein